MCPCRNWVLIAGCGAFLLGCLGPMGEPVRFESVPPLRASVEPPVEPPAPPVPSPPSPSTVAPSAPLYALPLSTFRVRSPYGSRGRKFHTGVDLIESARGGDPVVASRGGVVEEVTHRGGYGRMVLLRHGDAGFTRYAHLRKVTVRKGQTVSQGETIGFVGHSGRASGPHLHFEILTAERKPVDPLPLLFPKKKEDPHPKLSSPVPTPNNTIESNQ